MPESDDLLSLFDHHIHPVLAIDKNSLFILYANVKAGELFQKKSSDLIQKPFSSIISGTEIQHNEELFFKAGKTYLISRLNSPSFSSQVLFLIDKESVPSESSITTAELAASLVAHLFRSPLTALLGLADMAHQSDSPNQEKIAKALTDGLRRISGFVDTLDSFNVHDKAELQPVFLAALIKDVVHSFTPQQRQLIQIETPPHSVEIQTDAKIVSEILHELIQNAFENGIDALSPVQIQLKENHIYISNPGYFPKDVEKHLFNPFFTTKSQHWGLGLTKCVKKARSIGAHLRLVENSRIKGIVFELNLPNRAESLV